MHYPPADGKIGLLMVIKVQLAITAERVGSEWVACCPAIDVASQARTKEAARGSLQEAIELWFESCMSRGVLDEALRDAGFVQVENPPSAAEYVVTARPSWATAQASEVGLRESPSFRVAKSQGKQFLEGLMPCVIPDASGFSYASIPLD